MAPILRPPRKRKRDSNASARAWEDDTMHVVSRRTVASKSPSERPPLEETHTRRNAAPQRRTATRVQATTDVSSAPTPESDENISADCCYHCYTRGGNAAYECHKDPGQEKCSRCIKDGKNTCRVPTDEEVVAIEARCPQCKRRGFKRCDGGIPCDTCKRNGTAPKCQRPDMKRIKRNDSQHQTALLDQPCDSQPTAVARRGSATQSWHEAPDNSATAGENGVAMTAEYSQYDGVDHAPKINIEDDTSHCNLTLLTKRSTPFTEQAIQNLLESQMPACLHGKGSRLDSSGLEDTATPSSPSERSPQAISLAETKEHSIETSHGALTLTGNNAQPLPPVPDESTTDDHALFDLNSLDADVNQTSSHEAQQSYHLTPPPEPTTRPRRSLGKVSYAEITGDDFSSPARELEDVDDVDDTDVYISNPSDTEIDADEVSETVFSEDEVLVGSDLDASDKLTFLDEPMTEDEELLAAPAKSRRQAKARNTSQQRVGKGIDLSLPPLNNIESIFSDMGGKAAQFGILEALKKLKGAPLKVATMCSGTESPLLALTLLSKALENAGHSPVHIQHAFSAEIETIKQGYIERNFQPKVLFRDIREFIGNDRATTAYGAEVDIPSDLDILVAGFVCKDLSRMNAKRKDLASDGESGDTWRAVYEYANRFRPGIVLLENVKARKAVWDDVVKQWAQIGYEAAWVYCDTKNYYLPQTRERMYMIAIERSRFGENVTQAGSDWEDLMKKFQRQCSSPYEAFLSGTMHEPSNPKALQSEPDWDLCKLRYDHMRSDQKLGILRTLTRWSENGTSPPDYADKKWYNSQSSRIPDAIEVANLQAAQKGYDSQFKMVAWDVSQNADRFKAPLGILSCIAPDGIILTSNRHQPLNGKQLLLSQGMPMDKLLFARETQKDCQDLAGNAMSTTVIGASLIAAIIVGWKSFRPDLKMTMPTVSVNLSTNASTTELPMYAMRQHDLHQDQYETLDLGALRHEAMLSTRMCNCEGDKTISKVPIQECVLCGHTACVTCAGNPKHAYSTAYGKRNRSNTPVRFINDWRRRLPARVMFNTFPDFRTFASETTAKDDSRGSFIDRILEVNIQSQHFCLGELTRQNNAWIAMYNSPQARLELRIGHDIQWLLFVQSPPALPGNSPLRQMLDGPLARALVDVSLLGPQWETFIPFSNIYTLQMTGSIERHSSWRSRIGLPKFKAETVPSTVRVESSDAEATRLTGVFDYLPHCGTASSSLYKRSSDPALYMFLDPDPIGAAVSDSVVFSYDCSRKHFGDSRISLARLDPSWRPWLLTERSSKVKAVTTGTWVPVTMQLIPTYPLMKASVLSEPEVLQHLDGDCSHSVTILIVEVPECLPVQLFADYSWTFEQAKFLPSFSTWQLMDTNSSTLCSCAPTYPRILWNVSEKGVATPQEDRQAAARFERGTKTRPPIFQLHASSTAHDTRIQVGINVRSLAHSARGRLAQLGLIDVAWRLVTDHLDMPTEPFPKFILQNNAQDTPGALPPSIRYLRGTQPSSLSWMVKQEQGMSIKINEVEEQIHAGLGWRAEARAQITLQVRGGVLADLPSFGKTVTTIALIQREFEQFSAQELLHRNTSLTAGLPTFIDLATTLIVCPPHIARQWQLELKRFLGTDVYDSYNILLIESFSRLRRLTIRDFQNSKAVILSWNVLAEEGYNSELARFAGMPELSTTSRRAFDAWFSRIIELIPGQLGALQSAGFADFQRASRELLAERLQHADFQAVLPVSIQHGSAYQSFAAMQSASDGPEYTRRKSKSQSYRQPSSPEESRGDDCPVPLIHLFRFNRIVIDEYHYLNDDKKNANMLASVSVKKIASLKRWVLSGTPALANFTDVDQIASYLGIKLGRYHYGDGTVTSQLEKVRRSDQTLVEDFLSQTEVLSRQWHQSRHDQAQNFLDLFVRRNEPELQHIPCSESLVAIELSLAHHAVYLEHSQHLMSQRMQIKKLNNKSRSDRTERLNASLQNSATAEEALIKSSLVFESTSEQSELDALMQKRLRQRHDTEKELLDLMAGLEGLKLDTEFTELYGRFKKDIKGSNWLGDQETMQKVRCLLVTAENAPKSKVFPELRKTSGIRAKQYTKKLLSQVREISRELVLRVRSYRFISSILDLAQQQSQGIESFSCGSPGCKGSAKLGQHHLISYCGHTACDDCLNRRLDDESCVEPSCNAPVQSTNLIRVSDLGLAVKQSVGRGFGEKLDTVAEIIRKFQKDEQGLVFAPNEEATSILETVFGHYHISYHSPNACRPWASAALMEDFKTNKDPATRKTVLILNLGSEAAAGVNLVNANHIIFVSPFLTKSQYEYDSAMAQAIARSRRYGQKKTVNIYYIAAQRTIDVDILEHRHLRNDGISTAQSLISMPTTSNKTKEKTRLIKNDQGHMVLVPSSWLVDEDKRRILDVVEVSETFTSLINFSEIFRRDEG